MAQVFPITSAIKINQVYKTTIYINVCQREEGDSALYLGINVPQNEIDLP